MSTHNRKLFQLFFQKTHMISHWPPAPDHETGSGASSRSGWQFPSGSWMMPSGSRQSGRLIFGDPVPAQKTVPDAAASSPRLYPASRSWTHAKSTRTRSPAAWRHSAASPLPPSTPAFDMPDRTCGLIGTQQMKDHGNEHPAAGQAATQPA